MTANAPAAPPPSDPDWPCCGHGSDTSADAAGCRGRRVAQYAECLAHLGEAYRSAYLAGLQPGADLDLRGTRLTEELLNELLARLRDPATDRLRFGKVSFGRAEFAGDARFDGAEFGDEAGFAGAKFVGDARFLGAQFKGTAWFSAVEFCDDAGFPRAKFGGDARFDGARFHEQARFRWVEFGGDAEFNQAAFGRDARFSGARFGGDARFLGAKFQGNAWFDRAVFGHASAVGPLVCEGELILSEAVFGVAVTIEAATAALTCRRTRWASTAALRLRYAGVDLSDAVLEYPLSVVARSWPFAVIGEDVAGQRLTDPRVRVHSVQGVDAAHLVLTDVDLTECRFAGTVHLDQLRMEGRCVLATTPSGIRRRGWWPVRWTPRRTLAEEHHWRAARDTAADGWTPADGENALEPAALAAVYRQLRKASEDGKNEPGAADFYYGEMEMRRHDPDTPRAERGLLALYWAVSGYGLRASRALGWLLLAMIATVAVMMLWGLPKASPKPESTGTVTGRSITLRTDTPAPVNPDGPYRKRLTAERFERSLRVVINSVVFRSSGQDLTTMGTYTEMASRLSEPVLLGLAVLAVRGRVKR
ncbi:pentapeptide repeat-containing protein [Streptomyces sp. NPDC006283]|uniref:pentapeptide repeat-containing protein n=1 Tax=Streptomyces sp. NPDC006283 TaxID=3156741 RepID=UPI0033AAF26C